MNRLIFLLTVLAVSSAAASQPDQISLSMGSVVPLSTELANSEKSDFNLHAPDFKITKKNKITAKYSGLRIDQIKPEGSFVTRGKREAQLYAAISPSVVLVATKTGFGSGSIVGEKHQIITNWHVIEGYSDIGVIYKPLKEGREITKADIYRAEVTRFNEVSDLALLTVINPPKDITPISLGNVAEVPIGSDVHAIGHPTGESWTYTRGIVSQIRQNYQWQTESKKEHRADVIQTQTPINPGNSGGPLLSDEGNLIGVNSFISEGQGLNFAVTVDEVKILLNASDNKYAADVGQPNSNKNYVQEECDGVIISSERDDSSNTSSEVWDLDCDGVGDAYSTFPDDQSKPSTFSIDSTGNGKIDTVYGDTDRDGNIDISFYDTTDSGEPDMVGYHKNGNPEPYKMEKYPS